MAPGAPTSLEEFLQLRGSLTRDAFLAQYPSPVLLIAHGTEADADVFQTQVLQVNSTTTGPGTGPRNVTVVPVQKRRGAAQQAFIWVGREPNCDVVLAFEGVSKLQAHFTRRPNGDFELLDANSTNGTYVEGRRLGPNEPAVMKDGAKLRFGPLSTRFRTAEGFWDELGTA